MKTARRILETLGGLLVDFVGLFLGYPEREGGQRRTVGEALLFLGLLAVVMALFITAS
ncbi:MAG: hypothetical protein HUU33_00490 [Flavobacteriales bacterium]|nr:hypothetical protein [Flavobacteriales bacterium]NUQ13781.1 hypothetical protein [Flavobacteriales bacterium]